MIATRAPVSPTASIWWSAHSGPGSSASAPLPRQLATLTKFT
jgi:hypothetical protein